MRYSGNSAVRRNTENTAASVMQAEDPGLAGEGARQRQFPELDKHQRQYAAE